MANEIRNPGKALRWAEEGLKNAPFHPWLLRGKCEALINLDMPDRARQCIAEVEDRFGDAPALRNSLAMLEGNFDEVVARIEPFLDDTSLPSGLRNEICIPLILAGRSDLAWPVMLDARPDWTGDEPVDFASVNFFRMVPAAALLYENGRVDRANYLFDGMLEAMAGTRFRRGVGSLDVGIHYVRGDYEKADVALRDAIDEGVYGGWWYYDRSPVYDDMRADPELSALLEEMKAEIARQREWYEKNRNKPLF